MVVKILKESSACSLLDLGGMGNLPDHKSTEDEVYDAPVNVERSSDSPDLELEYSYKWSIKQQIVGASDQV
jgi:hypothetical protein